MKLFQTGKAGCRKLCELRRVLYNTHRVTATSWEITTCKLEFFRLASSNAVNWRKEKLGTTLSKRIENRKKNVTELWREIARHDDFNIHTPEIFRLGVPADSRIFLNPDWPSVEIDTKCYPWDFSPILNVIVTRLSPGDPHLFPQSHPVSTGDLGVT